MLPDTIRNSCNVNLEQHSAALRRAAKRTVRMFASPASRHD
jgi:hypothetical protein